ncbi:glycoprotein 3-alpha-L-fucosyltransferase A-like protein [Tanacetum coccineum]
MRRAEAEYDIMAQVQPNTEKTLAAAFISKCVARNFRLQALDGLEKENIKIDSYAGCGRCHCKTSEMGEGWRLYFHPIFMQCVRLGVSI